MAVNSPQPTLLCVIILLVCLSSLDDQDIPFLDFFVLSVVVLVVPTRAFVGRGVDRYGDRLKTYIAVVTGGRGTKVSFILKFI